MPSTALNPWLVLPSRRPEPRLRLFCFPCAGGTASNFASWPVGLPATVEVCAIQLPGRATRFAETPLRHMTTLIPALEDALLPAADRPFAFFGHSMGAFVGFELARRLQRRHHLELAHLFVSGAGAPHLASREPRLHELPEREFSAALSRLGGTPGEVLASQELMKIVAPALRADFAICETYAYQKGRLLTCPITAFGGQDDRRVRRGELAAWAAETRAAFAMHLLPGDHFFLRPEEPALLALISGALAPFVNEGRGGPRRLPTASHS